MNESVTFFLDPQTHTGTKRVAQWDDDKEPHSSRQRSFWQALQTFLASLKEHGRDGFFLWAKTLSLVVSHGRKNTLIATKPGNNTPKHFDLFV